MEKEVRITEINKLAEEAYKKLLLRSKSYLRQVTNKLYKKGMSEERKITHTFAIFMLNQNIITAKTIKKLISKRQLDEGMILMRVIIERSALVYKCLESNLAAEDIERLRGSDCIKYLKSHFNIGRLYGLFSDIVHSKPYPSILFAILDFYAGKKKVKTEKVNDVTLLFNILLIFVLEVNFAVTEFLAKDYIVKIKSKWSLKGNFWTYLPISSSRFKYIYEGLITCYKLYDNCA